MVAAVESSSISALLEDGCSLDLVAAAAGHAFRFVAVRVEMHCEPKLRFMASLKRCLTG